MKMGQMGKRMRNIMVIAAAVSAFGLTAQALDVSSYTQEDLDNCTTIVLEEKEYQVPFALSELFEAGWSYEFSDIDYEPNEVNQIIVTNDTGSELYLTVKNRNTESSTPISECDVIGLTIQNYPGEPEFDCEVEMKNGLKLGMSLEEAMECFEGTVEEEEDYYRISAFDESDTLRKDQYEQVSITFEDEEESFKGSAVFAVIEEKVCVIMCNTN